MKQKKIRRRYVVLAILAALVVLAAVLAHWQRNNIQAVKDFTTYTQEELEEQLQQNDQTIKETVNALPEVTVRDVTEEEKQALRDGTMTREELADRLLTTPPQETAQPIPEDQSAPVEEKPAVEQPAVSQPQTQEPEVSKPAVSQPAASQPAVQAPETKPVKSEYEQQLSALVAKVYVLREDYMIALDNLQAEAIAAYKAIPSEQRSGSKLADFVSSFLAKGTALEKDCDKKMDAIVKEMEQLVKANKGDLSLIDTVISTYANEKSLKKAWYMSELEKRGFI